jgi:hypothetical protein
LKNLNECVGLYNEFCAGTLYQKNYEKCFDLGFAPPSEKDVNEVEFGVVGQDTKVALIE